MDDELKRDPKLAAQLRRYTEAPPSQEVDFDALTAKIMARARSRRGGGTGEAEASAPAPLATTPPAHGGTVPVVITAGAEPAPNADRARRPSPRPTLAWWELTASWGRAAIPLAAAASLLLAVLVAREGRTLQLAASQSAERVASSAQAPGAGASTAGTTTLVTEESADELLSSLLPGATAETMVNALMSQ